MAYVNKSDIYKLFDESNGVIRLHVADVDMLPTAEVAEVKHGEWKDRYNNKYYNHLYECSDCGKEALCEFYSNELGQEEARQALTPICPYCGAKMDGARKEEK